jgi:hypothetical protein
VNLEWKDYVEFHVRAIRPTEVDLLVKPLSQKKTIELKAL